MATFYTDNTDFTLASAVWSDSGLTTKGSDGFYSNNGIVREQSSGSLLPATDCAACPVACATAVAVATGEVGVYEISFTASAGTGVMAVLFDPNLSPKGISAVYDDTLYTRVISDGVSVAGNSRTFVGKSSENCGLPSAFNLPKYKYGAASFVDTGETVSFGVQESALNLSTAAPANTYMFIPKTAATPTEVKITVYVPCPDDTDFDIQVNCPLALTGFSVDTTFQDNDGAACALGGGYGGTYYNYPIVGSAGVPAVGDIIFTDANGQTLAGAGYYNASVGGADSAVFINSNGVVESITACSNTLFVSDDDEVVVVEDVTISITTG